jgi:hypothetical protein
MALLPTIAAGLGSRRFGSHLPSLVAAYAGDILWGTMFMLILLLLAPRIATMRAALLALAITWGIELSQLYHAPWIDALRDTTPGGLLLGHGFLWSDIVCCAGGVLLGILLDRLLIRPSAAPGSLQLRSATSLDDISLRR